MERYYFLFILAFVWMVFASIQDFRRTEIANWLNFSLVAFALSYRAFYSVYANEYQFFLFGILGFILFFLLGNLFYYTRVFGGGDAKLLSALGSILPFEKAEDFLALTGEFLVLLFFIGFIYSLFYSFFIISKNKDKFGAEFGKNWKKYKIYVIAFIILNLILIAFFGNAFIFIMLIFGLLIYFYFMTFERSCLVVLKKPGELILGDWLKEDVKIRGKIIRKNIYGLSEEEIRILKRHRRKVLIVNGLVFAPVFLVSFLAMVLIWVFLQPLIDRTIFLFLGA